MVGQLERISDDVAKHVHPEQVRTVVDLIAVETAELRDSGVPENVGVGLPLGVELPVAAAAPERRHREVVSEAVNQESESGPKTVLAEVADVEQHPDRVAGLSAMSVETGVAWKAAAADGACVLHQCSSHPFHHSMTSTLRFTIEPVLTPAFLWVQFLSSRRRRFLAMGNCCTFTLFNLVGILVTGTVICVVGVFRVQLWRF